ncbi:hypothetical protein A3Q56_05191 [Intoshia linei]|uniref:Transcription initiation factor TFIID subunit 2 n=1 Tax=Intoshia linei TaxID=1819745 RepID=A0A177AYH7_9BILA|nr:hypothetical protein A3Q56_05191 [Intoshia linei]
MFLRPDDHPKIVHQNIHINEINFANKKLTMYTEMYIQPIVDDLDFIRFNCLNCVILNVTLNETDVNVVYEDVFQEICPETNDETMNFCAYETYFNQCIDMIKENGCCEGGQLKILIPHNLNFKKTRLYKIGIYSCVEKPTHGLQFNYIQDDESTICSMFTVGSSTFSNLWFPCVFAPSALCTWRIEIKTPIELSAVASGTMKILLSSNDEKFKTYQFVLSIPTSALNIGLVVGNFETFKHPELNETVISYCVPGLVELVKHSTKPLKKMIDFYEELLSIRFPFDQYKQVFMQNTRENFETFSSLTIFSINILHHSNIIDQVYETRQVLAHSVARQFFTSYVTIENWRYSWIVLGISKYLVMLYYNNVFGNNAYLYQIYEYMNRLEAYERNEREIMLETDKIDLEATISYVNRFKIAKDKMTHDIISATNVIKIENLKSTNYNIRSNISQKTSNLDKLPSKMDMYEHFGVESVNSNDVFPYKVDHHFLKMYEIKAFLVFKMIANRVGISLLLQVFNKNLCLANAAAKDNYPSKLWIHMQFTTYYLVKSIYNVSGKNVSNIINRWCTTFGIPSFSINIYYNRKRNSLELDIKQNNSKNCTPYEPKKKKNSNSHRGRNSNGSDQHSPVLWVMVDTEMNILRRMKIKIPQYMARYVLRYEKCIIAQKMAIEQLSFYQNLVSQTSLTNAVEDEQCFYKIRIDAIHALSLVINANNSSWSGSNVLVSLYKQYFFYHDEQYPYVNDFTNIQKYFVMKALLTSISQIRNPQNKCPVEIVKFLLVISESNYNVFNKYSDCYFRKTLIEALSYTLTSSAILITAETDANVTNLLSPQIKTICKHVVTNLNIEQIIPSYKHRVSISCLYALRQLQVCGYIPVNPQIFYEYSSEGLFVDVRIASMKILISFSHDEKDVSCLLYVLNVIKNEDNCYLRTKLIKMLNRKPPFNRNNENSPINNRKVMECLWEMMNGPLLSNDAVTKQSLCLLWKKMYGEDKPFCIGGNIQSEYFGMNIDNENESYDFNMLNHSDDNFDAKSSKSDSSSDSN